jgi:hypothetical protein
MFEINRNGVAPCSCNWERSAARDVLRTARDARSDDAALNGPVGPPIDVAPNPLREIEEGRRCGRAGASR